MLACGLAYPEFHCLLRKQYLLRASAGHPTYLGDQDFWFMSIQLTSIMLPI